jgi:hypothetical protein
MALLLRLGGGREAASAQQGAEDSQSRREKRPSLRHKEPLLRADPRAMLVSRAYCAQGHIARDPALAATRPVAALEDPIQCQR